MAQRRRSPAKAKSGLRKVRKRQAIRKTKGASRSAKAVARTGGKRSIRRKRKGFGLAFAPGLEAIVAASPLLSKVAKALQRQVVFTVAPKTVSGQSIQSKRGMMTAADLADLRARPNVIEGAAATLEKLGFEVLYRGESSLIAAGSAKHVSDVLKIELAIQARPRPTSLRATQNFAVSYEVSPEDLYVAPVESLTVKSTVCDDIDDFIFMPPSDVSAPISPIEPASNFFGIGRADIRRLLNVPIYATGADVTVALIDTGFFQHPYFQENGLRYAPTATALGGNPTIDTYGHGTAMAYNLFAVAPQVTMLGYKRTDPAPEFALLQAANHADIISCSWGYPQAFGVLEHEIIKLVQRGKIVLFAAGNTHGHWPASMPDVLAIGGVYADQNNQLEASNFASGFMTSAGRQVPDVCGLCGMRPLGVYIMMPSQPNSESDEFYSRNAFPNGDHTARDDGWFSASGTSAATAQVAGVVALLVQRARQRGTVLTTAMVKALLQQTAIPVQRGKNAQGVPAVGHPNGAVGFGLVDASAALARI